MKIKEVKESCNCIWKHCEHHKDGALCPHDAIGIDCGFCDKTHWVGDKSLGNGFRLCTPCAASIMEFMADELPHFMNSISPFVPKTMKNLESVLKDYYLSYVTMERSDVIEQSEDGKEGKHVSTGWRTPIRDARALLEFVGIVLQKKGKAMPGEVLDEGIRVARKHKDLVEAFSDFEETLIKEEKKK